MAEIHSNKGFENHGIRLLSNEGFVDGLNALQLKALVVIGRRHTFARSERRSCFPMDSIRTDRLRKVHTRSSACMIPLLSALALMFASQTGLTLHVTVMVTVYAGGGFPFSPSDRT